MKPRSLVETLFTVIIIATLAAIGYFALVNRQVPSQAILPAAPPAPLPSISQTASENTPDGCSLIANSSFRSINKYEAGLGPSGPVAGYWSIQFQTGTTLSDYGQSTFKWQHSDVVESGTYTCKDNVLQVKFYGRSFTSLYNDIQKILTWDGIEYRLVD